MTRMTTKTLSDLNVGDRITNLGTISHERKPLIVSAPLTFITPGSPVRGVRCGILAGGTEMVLYPSQCDGLEIVFERA